MIKRQPGGNEQGVMGRRSATVCRESRTPSDQLVRYLTVWFELPLLSPLSTWAIWLVDDPMDRKGTAGRSAVKTLLLTNELLDVRAACHP